MSVYNAKYCSISVFCLQSASILAVDLVILGVGTLCCLVGK